MTAAMMSAMKFMAQFADEVVVLKVARTAEDPLRLNVLSPTTTMCVGLENADGGVTKYTFSTPTGRVLTDPLVVRQGLLSDTATTPNVTMSVCLSRFRPYAVELSTAFVRYAGKAQGKTVVVHNAQGKFACELLPKDDGSFEVRVDRLRVCVHHALLMLLPAMSHIRG